MYNIIMTPEHIYKIQSLLKTNKSKVLPLLIQLSNNYNWNNNIVNENINQYKMSWLNFIDYYIINEHNTVDKIKEIEYITYGDLFMN